MSKRRIAKHDNRVFQLLEDVYKSIYCGEFLSAVRKIGRILVQSTEKLERVLRKEKQALEIMKTIKKLRSKHKILCKMKKGRWGIDDQDPAFQKKERIWTEMSESVLSSNFLEELLKQFPDTNRETILPMFFFGHFFGIIPINGKSSESVTREGTGLLLSHDGKFLLSLNFKKNEPSIPYLYCDKRVLTLVNEKKNVYQLVVTTSTSDDGRKKKERKFKRRYGERVEKIRYKLPKIIIPSRYDIVEAMGYNDSDQQTTCFPSTDVFRDLFPPKVLHFCLTKRPSKSRNDISSDSFGYNAQLLRLMFLSKDRETIRVFLRSFPESLFEYLEYAYQVIDEDPPFFTLIKTKDPDLLQFVLEIVGKDRTSRSLLSSVLPKMKSCEISRGYDHHVPLIIYLYKVYFPKKYEFNNYVEDDDYEEEKSENDDDDDDDDENEMKLKFVLRALGPYIDWNGTEKQKIRYKGMRETHLVEKLIQDNNLSITQYVIEELPRYYQQRNIKVHSHLDFFNLQNEHKFTNNSQEEEEEEMNENYLNQQLELSLNQTVYGFFEGESLENTDISDNETYRYILRKRNLWNLSNFKFFSREYKHIVYLFIWCLEEKFQKYLPNEMISSIFQYVDFFDFQNMILGDWVRLRRVRKKMYIWRSPLPKFQEMNSRLYDHEVLRIKKFARDTFRKRRKEVGELEFKGWIEYCLRNRNSFFCYRVSSNRHRHHRRKKTEREEDNNILSSEVARNWHYLMILFVHDLKKEIYFRSINNIDYYEYIKELAVVIKKKFYEQVKKQKEIERVNIGGGNVVGGVKVGKFEKEINWLGSSSSSTKYYYHVSSKVKERKLLGKENSVEVCVGEFLELIRELM